MAKRGMDIIYIQVAYTIPENAIEREFGNLLEIKDAYPKIVVSTDALPSQTHKGVKRIPLYDFIKNFT
jgi:predicted AAA+ superfamily ATPase